MTEKPISVTVHDPESGHVAVREFMDDYAIVVAGTCRYSVVANDDGTHVITVTGRKEPTHG